MTSIVHDIVVKAWKPHKSVSLKKLDKNTFLFVVSHETDLKLALDKRPWSIRGAHLVLKTWNPMLTWQEVDFSSSTFWIQIHGLPALWYDKDNIMKIGNKVRRVIDEDFLGDPPLPWQHFTRIRMEVDFAVPLLPGLYLPRNGLMDVWIALKYERLPKLCYNCGILGHDGRACRLRESYSLISLDASFRLSVNGLDQKMILSPQTSMKNNRLLIPRPVWQEPFHWN